MQLTQQQPPGELEAEMKDTLGEGGGMHLPNNVGYVWLFAGSKHYYNIDHQNTLQSLDQVSSELGHVGPKKLSRIGGSDPT